MKVGVFSDFGPTSTNIIVPLLERMYELADLCIDPILLPSSRSAMQLKRGELDAEMVRVPTGIAATNDQVILVPQPIFVTNVQFTWVKGLDFNGTLQDVAGRSVGLLRGQHATRNRFEKLTNNLTLLPNLNSAADLLARGRVEVLVSDGVGHDELEKSLLALDKPLETKIFLQAVVYHVLQVRHTDKAERLASALKTMIKGGEISHLGNQYGLHAPPIVQ